MFHHGRECRPTAWYNTVMARRRRGEGPNNEEEAVDEIAEAMEGDERLMSDNVDGEIKRRCAEVVCMVLPLSLSIMRVNSPAKTQLP